ncbi:hypothetical protein JG688_00008559 [Phytophthora aleatoria]|uniref:Uncharacterized protein n=1 Tax=Phytophthora aleatoria TaxID=2496075 RepID=A0A8J5INE6_9STRA|nr:hypothetical protein JG688_00008559 [Phytophthora aleatoria]
MFLQNEAKRPGLPHDHMEMGYLFDLNEDAVLDAFRFRLRQQEQVHQPRRRNAQLHSEGGERMWCVPHQNMDAAQHLALQGDGFRLRLQAKRCFRAESASGRVEVFQLRARV